MLIRIERRDIRGYKCSGCRGRTWRVRDRAEQIRDDLPWAEHLQHSSAALDEVRRQEFFPAGAVMRAYDRGKRWLLLRPWKTVRGSKRQELQQLFAANQRLFNATSPL